MADASGHDKEMENLVRAEIAVAGVKKREPQRIDDAAYGVEEPAGQQPGPSASNSPASPPASSQEKAAWLRV